MISRFFSRILALPRMTYSLGALVVAVGIMYVSLMSTATSTAARVTTEASHRQLYVSKELKPDHVLFPMIGLRNQVELALLPDGERAVFRCSLAHKLRTYVPDLLDSDMPELALETLLKSHYQVALAVGEVGAQTSVTTASLEVLECVADHDEFLRHYFEKFPVEHQDQLAKMQQETESFSLSLR